MHVRAGSKRETGFTTATNTAHSFTVKQPVHLNACAWREAGELACSHSVSDGVRKVALPSPTPGDASHQVVEPVSPKLYGPK